MPCTTDFSAPAYQMFSVTFWYLWTPPSFLSQPPVQNYNHWCVLYTRCYSIYSLEHWISTLMTTMGENGSDAFSSTLTCITNSILLSRSPSLLFGSILNTLNRTQLINNQGGGSKFSLPFGSISVEFVAETLICALRGEYC